MTSSDWSLQKRLWGPSLDFCPRLFFNFMKWGPQAWMLLIWGLRWDDLWYYVAPCRRRRSFHSFITLDSIDAWSFYEAPLNITMLFCWLVYFRRPPPVVGLLCLCVHSNTERGVVWPCMVAFQTPLNQQSGLKNVLFSLHCCHTR